VTALLFPTSDFRHPVTTPALLYISQALTKVHARIGLFTAVSLELFLFRLFPPSRLSWDSPFLIVFESGLSLRIRHLSLIRKGFLKYIFFLKHFKLFIGVFPGYAVILFPRLQLKSPDATKTMWLNKRM